MAELSASEVLTVVAEISIALSGFAGVVVAFRQRGLDALLPHEQLRLRSMLLVACATLLFALLPFVPHYLRLALLLHGHCRVGPLPSASCLSR